MMERNKKNRLTLLRQVYYTRTVDYLLVLGCIWASMPLMHEVSFLFFWLIVATLLISPHVVFHFHKKSKDFGLKKKFEIIEYKI